jgi:hypothetical protein
MSDYWRERHDEEQAKNKAHHETRYDLRYLAGWYGEQAKRSGNADLAKVVRELTEVLDGTWQRPEAMA